MPKGDELLRAIEAVHAAGVDELGWPRALGAVTDLFAGSAASLEFFNPPEMRPTAFVGFNVPSACEIAYLDQYAALNPRAVYAHQHTADPVIWDYKVLDEAAMDRDPFYTELLPQTDFRYFISGQFVRPNGEITVVAAHRTRRQGHVGERDIASMRQLVPHLRQAVDVALRLGDTDRRVRGFQQALDWLADGAALVRRDGTALYVNEALQGIARRGDGIALAKGKLELSGPEAGHLFRQALAAACALQNGEIRPAGPTDFPVPRPSGAPPYLVSVRPLVATERTADVATRAEALVFVRDPAQRYAAATELLRAVFGLTEAEASLAGALQAGTTITAYARDLGLSLNTVYTHLRRVKEKTRCRRQAELIAVLNDMRLPLQAIGSDRGPKAAGGLHAAATAGRGAGADTPSSCGSRVRRRRRSMRSREP